MCDSILIVFNTTCYELHRISPIWYELHRINPNYKHHRINRIGYELHRFNRIWYEVISSPLDMDQIELIPFDISHMLGSFVSEYYWAPCCPPVVSCTCGVYRLLGTDEWTNRCNLPPFGGKLHLWHLPIIEDQGMELLVQVADLWRQIAPLAFTDWWTPNDTT